jgi:hypothetical protein
MRLVDLTRKEHGITFLAVHHQYDFISRHVDMCCLLKWRISHPFVVAAWEALYYLHDMHRALHTWIRPVEVGSGFARCRRTNVMNQPYNQDFDTSVSCRADDVMRTRVMASGNFELTCHDTFHIHALWSVRVHGS